MKDRKNRLKTRLPLEWRTSFESTIYNVSSGGLYFRSLNQPSVDSTIQLKFCLPNSDYVLETSGTVCWTSKHSASGNAEYFGVGVQFDEMPTEKRQKFDEYLHHLAGEQRTHLRWSTRVVIEYHFAGADYRTIANEISENGMFLVTEDPLQLDDIIHLRFSLPDSQDQIKTRAIVRWRHDAIPEDLSEVVTPGMGIEFCGLSKEDKQLISEFIDDMTFDDLR